jgi:hypothetical protein
MRDSLNLAVAICQFGGVYVKETTGTHYFQCRKPQAYSDAEGRTLQRFGSAECIAFLKAALRYFKRHRKFKGDMTDVMLVFDRSRVHSSRMVTNWLHEQGINFKLAPPRSPDLMPLDYAVFGTAKLELGRHWLPTAAWHDRVHTFLELLRKKPSAAIYDEFVERLQCCIQQNGGRFEQMLRSARER